MTLKWKQDLLGLPHSLDKKRNQWKERKKEKKESKG